MELALNLGWLLVAMLMFALWLRLGRRAGAEPRIQLVALTVLILILFPVISVTDDLQALQNPAEADSSLRRDHVCASPHSIFPAVGALPLPVVAELSFGVLRHGAPGSFVAPRFSTPALASIQNRPPPAA
jgi:hypothetical protein